MTSICITPSLDCKLAPKCERHFRHHPDKIDPDQSYQVNLGDTAMFACPNFREFPTVEDDGFVTMYASQGALR